MQISKSRIKMFESCPHRFELRYIQGIVKSNKYMVQGKEVHKIIENYYAELLNHEGEVTKEVMQDAIAKYYKEEYANYLTNFMNFNFWLKERTKNFLPIAVEKEIRIDSLELVGIIDAVFKTEKSLLILDFKTGNPNYVDSFELGLYAYLWDSFNDSKTTDGGFLFLKTNELKKETIDQKQIEKAVKKVELVKKVIESSTQYPKTKNKSNCLFCEYFSKECEGT